ncbi:hypothetical protein GRJ2_002315600 [Grus japonensis]|uniref:Uncharacterized protein n=1 Tax=Grus japonensis TaxID=30415 RepID=A0ABC9XN93_GRUJA
MHSARENPQMSAIRDAKLLSQEHAGSKQRSDDRVFARRNAAMQDPKNTASVFRLSKAGPQPAPFTALKPKEVIHVLVKLLQPENECPQLQPQAFIPVSLPAIAERSSTG